MSKHALIGLMIGSGCVLASASALADGSTADPNAQTAQTTTTKTTKKTKHEVKDVKAKADESTTPGSTTGNAKEGTAQDVGQAASQADRDAEKANASAVGQKQENKNEAEAQRVRPDKTNRQAHDAAKAIGKTTTSAADWVATGVEDTTRATDKPGHYAPFALAWNPLGVFSGGRVSLQFEYVPVTHHAIELSPHIIHTSADVDIGNNTRQSHTFSGFGGELGYRYYTGHRGPNGVFIGPSIIAGAYNASLPAGDQAFTDIGVAADVGVQTLIADHLVIGGGVGVEYLHVAHDFGDLPGPQAQIATSGVKPRLLFDVGAAF